MLKDIVKTLFCFILTVAAPLVAAWLDYRAPRGIDLPAAAAPSVSESSPWQQKGDLWVLPDGRPGLLEAPAWWEGNRPGRDELVVLELEYFDNLTKPIIVSVYSGLGSGEYFSELHRFSGAGDNTWKKARVPATADFIFTKLPEKTLRFRLESGGGELRVRNIRLAAPLPDEETRYNAETREWVARQQERGRIDPSYWEKGEKAVLPAEWSNRPASTPTAAT